MSTATIIKPITGVVFGDDEPVLQSHPLTDGVNVPTFATTSTWTLAAAGRPANRMPSAWALRFAKLDPVWNLRVREVAMVMLNPTHPAVVASGVHIDPRPASVGSVTAAVADLRRLAAWAATQGLPASLRAWQPDHVRRYVEQRRTEIAAGTLMRTVTTIRLLHQLDSLLTGGGLAQDPWPGRASRAVAAYRAAEVRTPNVAPQIWFPLVKAAWSYVEVFAEDILRARDCYRALMQAADTSGNNVAERVLAYLDDPANPIPLHTGALSTPAGVRDATGQINWALLGLRAGVRPHQRPLSATRGGRHVRARAAAALGEGRGLPGGLLSGYATVTRPDGTHGPWHCGLDPRSLPAESLALRADCYVFIAALSMMRDSEIREITRGAVVEHYGAPAVASHKRKRDPNLPLQRWWIIEPVAQAIAVAEALSWHPQLIFAASGGAGGHNAYQPQLGACFDSATVVKEFIARVNTTAAQTGLAPIPPGRVAPHMFRKTMAMLTGDQPGAEIALGLQLKHVATRALANRVTQGYAATDASWAKMIDTAVDEARFTRLHEFYTDYHAGKTIGYGPGADKLAAAFDTIKETTQRLQATGKARAGDARVEYDLLRKARIAIRFGKLNHCTMDENNPAGAKCLEDTILPDGHHGPLIDRCQPGRCANSVIGPEHLTIWNAERASLILLLDKPNLPPGRKSALHKQLNDVNDVIIKAQP